MEYFKVVVWFYNEKNEELTDQVGHGEIFELPTIPSFGEVVRLKHKKDGKVYALGGTVRTVTINDKLTDYNKENASITVTYSE